MSVAGVCGTGWGVSVGGGKRKGKEGGKTDVHPESMRRHEKPGT